MGLLELPSFSRASGLSFKNKAGDLILKKANNMPVSPEGTGNISMPRVIFFSGML